MSEVESGDSSQDVGSMASDDVAPASDHTITSSGSGVSGGVKRSGKISLPARMSDLYQTYPGDREGMVVAETDVPEIVLTRPSVVSLANNDNNDQK